MAGDVVGGAYPREALDLLAGRSERLIWINGNAEREAVAAWGGASTADDEPGRAAAWSAAALGAEWRHELASWPISTALDGVTYCHGSPRRDDEVLTSLTSDAVLREALGDGERVVVGGHTHQQVIRTVADAPTYVNAGSVGIPYEGRPGAFWLIVDDGKRQLRETGYDIGLAAAELRPSGFSGIEGQLAESLLGPVDPPWVAAFFEHAAGRRANPGPPPPRNPS